LQAVMAEEREMGGLWEKARGSVSVVGQDKGNASLYRAARVFRCYSYDFYAHQSDAHASLYRTIRASLYRALKKLSGPDVLNVPGGLIAITAGMGLLVFAGQIFHLRITLTDSAAPAGVYRVIDSPPARGVLVESCLPVAIARQGLALGYLQKGDCPPGAEPVAKVIGAVAGDVVELEPGWVAVNGVKFPNSQTAARDSADRSLMHVPSGARRVGAGEVWLFGFNNIRSWDARYFGPVPLANVRGVLRPLVTW
jgi:conjugative transfer signal peptidase TraF